METQTQQFGTKDFKRGVYKTLTPKLSKEAIKGLVKRQTDVRLVYSILGARSAVGQLIQSYRGFILGVQLNDAMKNAGQDALGNILHHAVNIAKSLKVKVPSGGRKIKPKNTHAYLLTEIDRVSADMFDTLFTPIASAKMAPMTDEEAKLAKSYHEARSAKAAEKAKAAGKEFKATEANLLKAHVDAIDVEKVKAGVSALLLAVYEFCWAVYHEPAVVVMAKHVEGLKPKYPAGFFDAPPPKPGPKKAPPKKAQDATTAPA